MSLIESQEEKVEFFPPENFSMVSPGVYRSALPMKKNFSYLKRLNLKSILVLFEEEYPPANLAFMKDNKITLLQFGVPGNKEPFVDIPEDIIEVFELVLNSQLIFDQKALLAVSNTENHPILVHCNKGKHRTGCLIGCYRKIQNWIHSTICDEYRRFSFPKSRMLDQQFIELFDVSNVNQKLIKR